MPAPLGLCHWFFQGVHLSIRPFIHSSICPSVHFSILPFAHSIVHSFWTFQTSDSNAANQWNVAHFSSSQISSRNYTNQMPHSMDLICLAFHLSIFFFSFSFKFLRKRGGKKPPPPAGFRNQNGSAGFPDPTLGWISFPSNIIKDRDSNKARVHYVCTHYLINFIAFTLGATKKMFTAKYRVWKNGAHFCLIFSFNINFFGAHSFSFLFLSVGFYKGCYPRQFEVDAEGGGRQLPN